MAKRANVTETEVADLIDRLSEMSLEVMNIAGEIRAWRCDDLTDATGKAREAATMAKHSADLASAILAKVAFTEREAALERLQNK